MSGGERGKKEIMYLDMSVHCCPEPFLTSHLYLVHDFCIRSNQASYRQQSNILNMLSRLH